MDDGISNPAEAVNGDQFPIGTIVYYGPDDKTTTKITAGVILSRNDPPILKKWNEPEVTTDPQVLAELGQFFREYGVKRVVMTDRNAGCPHEEGIDYPTGEECPYCLYWRGRKEKTK